MKSRNLMVALLVCFLTIPVHGQIELIKHSPDVAGKNALIREWIDTVSISYVESEKGVKYFVQDIKGHTTALAAPIPEGMTVVDMEVRSEFLYFCGTYNYQGITKGMVGILNIPNTFTWGQPYHIGLFEWVNDSLGGQIRMTTPQRIGSTWNNASADFFVSVVGKIEHKDPFGNITKLTGVCEAFTDATFSPWESGYYWCDDPDIVFTDITETDNFYVAVGRHATRQTTLVKRFTVPIPLIPFPPTPRPFTYHTNIVDFGQIDEVTDDITEGNVLTVATYADFFVLTNYYRDATSAGNTVKLFDASGLILSQSIRLQQNTTPVVSPAWTLREIQHDNSSGKTFVLQDMDYPASSGIASTICESELTPLSSIGLVTQPGFNSHGMGAWSGAGFQTIGDNSGELSYMRKKGGKYSSCKTSTVVYYEDNFPSVNIQQIPITEHGIGYQDMSTPQQDIVQLTPIKIIYDCVEY